MHTWWVFSQLSPCPTHSCPEGSEQGMEARPGVLFGAPRMQQHPRCSPFSRLHSHSLPVRLPDVMKMKPGKDVTACKRSNSHAPHWSLYQQENQNKDKTDSLQHVVFMNNFVLFIIAKYYKLLHAYLQEIVKSFYPKSDVLKKFKKQEEMGESHYIVQKSQIGFFKNPLVLFRWICEATVAPQRMEQKRMVWTEPRCFVAIWSGTGSRVVNGVIPAKFRHAPVGQFPVCKKKVNFKKMRRKHAHEETQLPGIWNMWTSLLPWNIIAVNRGQPPWGGIQLHSLPALVA